MEISGFHTTRQWRKIILLSLLPLLCIKRGSRGTEAVKLSAKLLSGLTLIALIAVAVIGLSNSASAAVDGKVYVTNKASDLTTEAGNPTAATTGRSPPR